MQTANQSLASLYMKRLITLETAMSALVEQGRTAGHDQPRRRRRRRRGAGPDGRDAPAARPPVPGTSAEERTMPTFAYTGRTRAGADGQRRARRRHDGRRGRRAAARADHGHADHAGQGRRPAAKADEEGGGGKIGKKVSAKNLAVFTRQFSVMIDAGLPLVQCLDILGNQEEDKNFAAVILADADRRRSRARRSPTRCASTRRRSIRSSPT